MTMAMPQPQVAPAQLIGAVDDFLSALPGSPGHNLGAGGGRPQAKSDALYEAYVYTLVADALEQLTGVPPVPKVHSNQFRVRRGPGEIHTTRATFSYLQVCHGLRRYELHLDTYVAARAPGAKLEVDILLITKPTADRCRRAATAGLPTRQPGFRAAWLVQECKYLTDKVDTTLATSHLGRWQQLGRADTVDGLVSNAVLTDNANALFNGCGRAAFPEILPAAWAQPNEAAFISDIRLRLQSHLPT